MASIPSPKNRWLSAINTAIEFLIQGLGENAAIGAIFTAAPELAAPIIGWMIKQFISWLGGLLDSFLEKHIDAIVIRFQYNISKETFDKVFAKLRQDQANPGVNPHEDQDLQDAKNAADDLIHGGHSI